MQPDMFASAVHALHLLLEPTRLLLLFVGVIIGLAIGVLPGLSGVVGLAMLIPFTYNLDEYTAFALLLGISIPILRPLMLSIGSPELLAFTLFGMSMVATLSGRAPLKGLTAAG